MGMWEDLGESEEEDLDTQVKSVASADYPVLEEILAERPPLPHSVRVAIRSTAGNVWELMDNSERAEARRDKAEQAGRKYCVICGRPVRDDASLVEVSIHGDIIPEGDPRSNGPESQGGWYIGPECIKKVTGSAGSILRESVQPRDLSAEAGIWGDLADALINPGPLTYNTPSFDWCRFRRDQRCYFPERLDEAATKQAGYEVWHVVDRGFCPRDKWAAQERCPVSEPGPNSNHPHALIECTRNWSEGGQRDGTPGPFRAPTGRWPSGNHMASVEHEGVKHEKYRGVSLKVMPGKGNDWGRTRTWVNGVEGHAYMSKDEDEALAQLKREVDAAIERPEAYEEHWQPKQAAWTDVRNKAREIRSSGGVKVIAVTDDAVTAEVKGEEHVYQTTLHRQGKSVALWECSCPWAAYSWGRSGRWKKYEGRMCAHALALLFEAQGQEFGGGQLGEGAGFSEEGEKPFFYEAPPIGDWQITAAKLGARWIVGVEEEGLGNVEWEGEATDVKDALRQWAEANGRALPANFMADAIDANRDGSYYEWSGHGGPSLFAEHTAKRNAKFPVEIDPETGLVYLDGQAITRYPSYHPTLGLTASLYERQKLAEIDPAEPDAGMAQVEEMCANGSHTHSGLVIKSVETGRVLLTQRTPYSEDPEGVSGRWEFPGGSIGDGETAFESALREFREETGLDLPEGWAVEGCYESGPYMAVIVLVPGESWTTDAELLTFETMGIGWFDPDQVEGTDIAREEMDDAEWDMVKEALRFWAGRIHCDGSNTEPLPKEPYRAGGNGEVIEGMWSSHPSPNATVAIYDENDGMCPVCHEVKHLLKSGLLPKHDRYISWQEQQALKAEGVIAYKLPKNGMPTEFPCYVVHEGDTEHRRIYVVPRAEDFNRLVYEDAEDFEGDYTWYQTYEDAQAANPAYASLKAEAAGAELHDEPEPALPSTDGAEDDELEQRRKALEGSAGITDADIAKAAQRHLAAAVFTPKEQMELIEEGDGEAVADNLDLLQIEGTHYEMLEARLRASDTTTDASLFL